MSQCTAKSKSSGERCKQQAITGRTVCHYHGGKTPRGFANPATRTGLNSKDLPTRLAARFDELERNEVRLDLSRELNLIQTLVLDALHRMDSGETGHFFRRLAELRRTLEEARRAQNAEAVASAFEAILATIGRGSSAYEAVEEVVDLIDRQAKLANQEVRRIQLAKESMSPAEADLFISATLSSVRRHVDDPHVRQAIWADINSIIGAGPSLDARADAGRLGRRAAAAGDADSG